MKLAARIAMGVLAVVAVAAVGFGALYTSRTQTANSIEKLTDYDDYNLYRMQVRYDYDLDKMIANTTADNQSFIDAAVKQALPLLRQSQAASILNIASVTAHKGYVRQAAYAASKHAMAGFTKTLAAEVYEQGIRVHLISPGGVFTDMAKVSRPDLTGEEMITAEDIAEIAAFLVLRRTNAVIDEIEVHRANKAPFT